MDGRSYTSASNGKKGGRPKGSTTRPQIRDFMTEEQIASLVDKAYEEAISGKTDMQKFLLEQSMGKAMQRQEVELEGDALQIVFDKVFKN